MSRSAKRAEVIVAIASGLTDTAAAAKCGVARQTITRWRTLPDFSRELDMVIERQRNRLEGRLAEIAEKATAVVEDALDHSITVDGREVALVETRLKAANIALTSYTRAISREAKKKDGSTPTVPLLAFPPGTRIALVADTNPPAGAAAPARLLPALPSPRLQADLPQSASPDSALAPVGETETE